MLQSLRTFTRKCKPHSSLIRKRGFLTNAYSCVDAWNARVSSPVLSKVSLGDFYNLLDQNHSSKGVISATDVDIFANAINDGTYLDELRDLLHKLRLSAETGATFESTHHATVRNYIEYGHVEELIEILKEPLIYGVFLDAYTANILLNKLLTSQKFDEAATVASLVMLQEDYSNDITRALCQYASYKFITGYIPPEAAPEQPAPDAKNKNKKVEEIKIRVKFLRNPYFDDHFDLKDPLQLSGKTLAWMSENHNDQLNNNLELIGWLFYKKYDKLLALSQKLATNEQFKIYPEVKELIQKECGKVTEDHDTLAVLEKCSSLLGKANTIEVPLEEALKISIENAINKIQNQDISAQQQLFKSWSEMREAKLNEQLQRLDRAKRIELIEEQQQKMKAEEQKLWFFEREDQLDLEIEQKENMEEKIKIKKSVIAKTDENYIPPEIIPKKK